MGKYASWLLGSLQQPFQRNEWFFLILTSALAGCKRLVNTMCESATQGTGSRAFAIYSVDWERKNPHIDLVRRLDWGQV